MTFEGRPGVVDVRGGWFDATGDYGKHLSHLSYSSFFNPQQVSLTAWVLFRALSALEERDGAAGAEPATKQYRKRLLDEALFGADSLVRLKDPNGSFYITVSGRGPEKKPEDRRITPKAERHIILTPETKDKFRDYGREKIAGDAAYEAGYREGAGLCIAALAMAAARSGAPGDPGYGVSRGEGDFSSAAYLKAAEDAFAFLEKNNLLFTNDGQENIVDDYCALIAAVPLYAVTGKPVYKAAADRRAASLMARLASWSAGAGKPAYTDYWRADGEGEGGDRPFFHPVDAGLPVVALLEYAALADPADRTKALAAVARSLAFELAITNEVTNPFGYSRQLVQSKDGAATRRSAFFFPHDTETAPWWQGENARLGSMAAASLLAARRLAAEDRGQRLHRPRRRLRPRPARLDPGAQSLRRLHAPRPRPQQHRLHVLRFLGVHERARRHLQRHHGRLRRRGRGRHRLRPALRRDRQGRRLALGRAVAAPRRVVSFRRRYRRLSRTAASRTSGRPGSAPTQRLRNFLK